MTRAVSIPEVRSGNERPIRRAAILIAALFSALALPTQADPGQDNRAPDVPASLTIPEGNKVSFYGHAVGVQIYVSSPSVADPTKFVWTFKAPEAVLYDRDGNVVATHYAGPTWESNSGGKVVGTRLAGVTVDATAIPWLLLGAATTQGPGVFENTTYVQRANTTGGLAPTTPPSQIGLEARVPYTADYYFFRESRR